jgi:hypothetical protein
MNTETQKLIGNATKFYSGPWIIRIAVMSLHQEEYHAQPFLYPSLRENFPLCNSVPSVSP